MGQSNKNDLKASHGYVVGLQLPRAGVEQGAHSHTPMLETTGCLLARGVQISLHTLSTSFVSLLGSLVHPSGNGAGDNLVMCKGLV